MDKTIVTNTKTFYLEAQTRGLVSAFQKFELVICDKTGSSLITKPQDSYYA